MNPSKRTDKAFKILSRIAFFMCGIIGILYSDDWNAVKSALATASTFLGIIASVSLALMALLVQSYERIIAKDQTFTAHLRYIGSFKKHLKWEVIRVIAMTSPIFLSIPVDLCVELQNSVWAVGAVATALCIGLVSSVLLPMKYGMMMSFYLDRIFEDANDSSKIKTRDELNEMQAFRDGLKGKK